MAEVVVIEGGPMFVMYTMAESCAELSMKLFEKTLSCIVAFAGIMREGSWSEVSKATLGPVHHGLISKQS